MQDETNRGAEDAAPGDTLGRIMAQVKDQRYPPVHLWHPDFCGDIDMRIAVDGSWFYMGTPIGRKEMVRLFSSILRHDDDGRYYLVTPVEKIGIQVDDAPLVAVELTRAGEGQNQTLGFRTQVDDHVIAGADNPIRVETDPDTFEPRPYILVRDRLEALINRSVFYELVTIAEQDDDSDELFVWSAGEKYSLGRVGS